MPILTDHILSLPAQDPLVREMKERERDADLYAMHSTLLCFPIIRKEFERLTAKKPLAQPTEKELRLWSEMVLEFRKWATKERHDTNPPSPIAVAWHCLTLGRNKARVFLRGLNLDYQIALIRDPDYGPNPVESPIVVGTVKYLNSKTKKSPS
jgi:hypothetical protein